MRDFDFPGRSAVHGINGAVATSHPYASQTALEVLRNGGNAVDAAIAAVATLCVVEPHMTGIGGDCFVLYAPGGGGEVVGLNGSGRAPAAADLETLRTQGLEAIDQTSPHAVTIPGAIDAWCRLHERHGSMDFAELLAPAIGYARDGYAVHARVANDWHSLAGKLRNNEAAAAQFLPGGAAPREGDLHRQPALADTLTQIARQGRKAFYEGPIAEAMVASLKALGGVHALEDFSSFESEWVTPISSAYRGYDIHQIPPNNQGVVALVMLNILEGYDLAKFGPLSPLRTHLEIEAGRLAYDMRNRHLADLEALEVSLDRLLSKDWAAELRAKIDPECAFPDIPDLGLTTSDTVYLTVVDRDLNTVSVINSLFHGFGSGILSAETGVVFQSRGASFRLDPAHPNRLAPNKRPMHTIMPGLATRNGQAEIGYGVMGGDYQPFGHARLLTNLIDYEMDPQAGLDCPRVFALGNRVEVEKSLPTETLLGLQQRGHTLTLATPSLGGGQCIRIDRKRGVLTAGSDPRKDGCALGY
ncbi:gamma-glutamyltransferase [Algihabitans albus]|uniref:gamma-glutamyltransferase n=1 Tax=Algihabitans albus TaxID=2164067 RepID=UPI000E5CC933|nr:gamma-glutamyltransferase [Algihabitans albus]